MAYGGPSNVRDNLGRFQKQATINLTKKLQELAKTTQKNVRETIAEELEKTYKENVLASYSPRGDGSYEYTGTFYDSIHVKIEEDRGTGRDRVKIMLDDNVYDEQYSRRTVTEVYEYLTEGTEGGSKKGGSGVYRYFLNTSKTRPFEQKLSATGKSYDYAYNYPTPPHNFELYTQEHMKGFLESLASDIKKGKYSK